MSTKKETQLRGQKGARAIQRAVARVTAPLVDKLSGAVQPFLKKYGINPAVTLERAALFAPAVFCVLTGASMLLVPVLTSLFAALGLCSLGAVLWVFAAKFLVLRTKVERLQESFQGQLLINSMPFGDDEEFFEELEEGKKITYH